MAPSFDTKSAVFKAALTLFLLLQLGVDAAARLTEIKRVGAFLVAFGTLVPLAHAA